MKPYDEMTEEELEADDLLRQAARFRPIERLSRPDAGHVLIVMSCVGREKLLGRTLASINFRSWPQHRRFLIKDSFAPRGQAHTFFTALRRAAAQPGFTYLTLVEDDVVAARRFLEYVATTKIPTDVAMVSWFHRLAPNPPQSSPTWQIGPAHEFSHQQAITLPAQTVRMLLASNRLNSWSEPHGADMLLGQVTPDAIVAYRFPCLVDHVAGEQSLTGNVGARRAITFVGEDFDALSLIPVDLT